MTAMMEELSSTCSFVSDELDGDLLMERYELGKLLGRGASAKVYHARDLRTGQSVAIKSVSKQRIFNGTNDHTPGHIMREISIMRKLRHHPHIVHLHEVLATKTKIHFVMEYAKGGELFGKIAKRGRFSEDLSRKYFQQLISAVSFCHSRNVFHRDLKPENLLLDENFELKVTDFGLSADQTGQDEMLHTLCGTPAYVAPEVLANKGYDGAKVDVWSCGVILYVLNAGYLPFNDTNLMAMYRKIYRGQFRCPKWTSPDLKRFLSRILDPNPVTRITIQQIMDDPWFQEGGNCNKEIECCYPVLETEMEFSHKSRGADSLNAFHLIAFSSGANLSGLLCDSESRVEKEMFLSRELPERISKRIQELAGEVEEEGVALKVVAKKGMGVRLQGQNGNFVVMVEINRLTEELVMVEITKGGFGLDIWKTKLKPRLNDLFLASNC